MQRRCLLRTTDVLLPGGMMTLPDVAGWAAEYSLTVLEQINDMELELPGWMMAVPGAARAVEYSLETSRWLSTAFSSYLRPTKRVDPVNFLVPGYREDDYYDNDGDFDHYDYDNDNDFEHFEFDFDFGSDDDDDFDCEGDDQSDSDDECLAA